jgi:hypothetical protein
MGELVLETAVSAGEQSRSRLAQRIFRLARSSWSDIQIKQLLCGLFRNEATRLQRVDRCRFRPQ